MSLVFRRKKFPLNRQICPVGRFEKSILLEVKALLQIQIQMPFPLNAYALRGLGHWHWLVSSGTSFLFELVSYLNQFLI